jgi:hypothetical protein
MKATNNSATTNKTQKPSPDIRNNALFTDITAQEEVFVRGGNDWYLKKEKGGA